MTTETTKTIDTLRAEYHTALDTFRACDSSDWYDLHIAVETTRLALIRAMMNSGVFFDARVAASL